MIKVLRPQSDTLMSRLSAESIPQRILTIRDHRVMIDADLAEVYGVSTKALNQAVKRNANRFPVDFAFGLRRKKRPNWSQIVTGSSA
jgi:hypothetical protein